MTLCVLEGLGLNGKSSGFTSLSELLGIKVHCPEVPQGLSLDRGQGPPFQRSGQLASSLLGCFV